MIVSTTLAKVGLDGGALDDQTEPCDDFYQFACGGWIEKTKIPDDKARWVRSFSEIHKRNEKDLLEILKSAAKGSADPAMAKLGGYFGACMDEAAVEKAGLAPLAPLFAAADSVKDLKTLTDAITTLHQYKIWAVFDISSEQDFKDATKMIAYLDQNGLGLPDRDYYEVKVEPTKKPLTVANGKKAPGPSPATPKKQDADKLAKKRDILKKYEAHVARMLELSGLKSDKAKAGAKTILKIETALATVSKTKVERRDPKALYNRVDRKGVEKTVSNMPWGDYFTKLGYPSLSAINITSPKFFSAVNDLLKSFKPAEWSVYLRWHVVDSLAATLPKAFVDQDFAMRKVLTGQEKQQQRWKRCVSATDRALGELLAQPFIKKRFAGKSKEAAESYVKEIGKAFRKAVRNLDWMTGKTRERALAKLDAMAYLIGYPPKWKKYGFEVGDAYAKNSLSYRRWDLKDRLGEIGKPVDREKWEMSPPTVNAYYHPLKNHMVFPAGILQPPFYSVDAAVPVNLGAMGMVVGHELTHGFDDQGAQFDKDGNLSGWWEPNVEKTFKEKTGCVDKQYSSYEVLPGLKLNGKLTLGENIADMGGVKLAFMAYRAMREGADTELVADGYTEDQQFFIATGQIWCSKYREQYARMAVQNDPHSNPRFRVNGPLSNTPEFASAFKCEAGSNMNPKNRCAVW